MTGKRGTKSTGNAYRGLGIEFTQGHRISVQLPWARLALALPFCKCPRKRVRRGRRGAEPDSRIAARGGASAEGWKVSSSWRGRRR